MLAIKNNLFTEITVEESATVSGGEVTLAFNLDNYAYIVGYGVLFGNSGLTTAEVQYAWETAFSSTDAATGTAGLAI
ncbi:hypothetical protein [Nostoc sp. CMAA1605]|uniref:hypothetical protein n=1 Tax=Nostoc sp. CMAA1605 TaxID=2055159 RepID=UPI001F438E8E|nr:hypothetical protein [Nostoc sp. CMAA1605]MCF4968061.1 hypothetical protein [Nostoc sp. CMAA1605]